MKKSISVTLIIAYLAAVLALLLYGIYVLTSTEVFKPEFRLLIGCVFIGGMGGALYLLRAVYLSYSVRKEWLAEWLPWYIVRPVASCICGGVSYLFLKAGLLVLEAHKESDASNLGFYALAFIAGMNVDKFIAKIEDLASATWGIDKTRSARSDEKQTI